jgi:hypothetical protein
LQHHRAVLLNTHIEKTEQRISTREQTKRCEEGERRRTHRKGEKEEIAVLALTLEQK